MFGKGCVFILLATFFCGILSLMSACIKNTGNVEVPVRPVASPTSTQDPQFGSGEQEASEPDVPFDGGRPEALGVPSPSTGAPVSPASPTSSGEAQILDRTADIYSELIGQSLSCEGTIP